MAIVSSSKRFIRSPSCQKVIGELRRQREIGKAADGSEGIWSGRIIYSAQNVRALIADVGDTFGLRLSAWLILAELQETAHPDVQPSQSAIT